jgi:hypothetical protein
MLTFPLISYYDARTTNDTQNTTVQYTTVHGSTRHVHGFFINIRKACSQIHITRQVNLLNILKAPLQQGHAKGITQPITRLADRHSQGRMTVHVRFRDHPGSPASSTAATDGSTTVAAVTSLWLLSTEHTGLDIQTEFGVSVALAKLAGFFFRREGKLHVFLLLRIRRNGSTDCGNPVGRYETVVDRPLMLGSLKDAIMRHVTQVKVRSRPGTVRRSYRCRSRHGNNRFVVWNSIFNRTSRTRTDQGYGMILTRHSFFCERFVGKDTESTLERILTSDTMYDSRKPDNTGVVYYANVSTKRDA